MAPEDGSPPEKEILNLETVMFRVYVSFLGVYEFLSKCGAKEHENSQNCWLHLENVALATFVLVHFPINLRPIKTRYSSSRVPVDLEIKCSIFL